MSACGKAFGLPRRLCALDVGHEGECAGLVDPEVFRQAKRARTATVRKLLEEGRVIAPEPEPGLPLRISPTALASLVLQACEGDGVAQREILPAVLRASGCRPGFLLIGGQPIKQQQIVQVVARLERDGALHRIGDQVVATLYRGR